MTVCSQYLRNVSKVFKLFPILITILLMWGLCAVLTVTESIGSIATAPATACLLLSSAPSHQPPSSLLQA